MKFKPALSQQTVWRNVRRQYLALLAMLLATISCAAAQYAAPQRIYVGILSGPFNYVAASQKEDEWCWAASAQMILQWYGLSVTQEMIVQRVKGALIDQGGNDREISAALNGWAPGINGRVWVVSSVTAPGPPAPTILINELQQQHPILLTFATGPSSGHAVVITAASYVPSVNGPLIQSLVIRDPWPTSGTIQTQGRVEIDGQTLANFLPSVRSHWLVSVTSGGDPSNESPSPAVGAESTGSNSNSTSAPCKTVVQYAESARNNFTSVKGELIDHDSDSSTYRGIKGDVPGFRDCTVEIFSDSDLEPSLECKASEDDFEELFGKIKLCFASWSVRHTSKTSVEQYELAGPEGVDVRLRKTDSGIRLWVDAPSRN